MSMMEVERELGSREAEMECFIFKIPDEVSKLNDKAYVPYAFSFGLFHHSNPRTRATRKIKLRYLSEFLLFYSGASLSDLTDAVGEVLFQALEHYDTPADNKLSPEELINVLVLDGCFIIELFLKHSNNNLIGQDDPIFGVPRMRRYLNHDLILLENQLPWMVLDTLFDVTRNRRELLVKLALDFFGPIFSMSQHPPDDQRRRCHSSRHILDLLRNSLLLDTTNYQSVKISDKSSTNFHVGLEPIMLSATALEDSGIKLQSIDSKSILDIEFKDGVLVIPQLLVHETTDALFRNLVALELYCPHYDGLITSYVKLFDDLVQNTADMKLLCDNKVVHNRLRLEKATRIFNQSSEEYSGVKENHYFDLIESMDQYCQRRKGYYIRRWRVYRRELKRVYFSHPWAAISTVAASLILIFTFLQTLFTIMSYK